MLVSVVVLIGKYSGATNAGIWRIEGDRIASMVWHCLINSGSQVGGAILSPLSRGESGVAYVEFARTRVASSEGLTTG
jgi:hypothetical protein